MKLIQHMIFGNLVTPCEPFILRSRIQFKIKKEIEEISKLKP